MKCCPYCGRELPKVDSFLGFPIITYKEFDDINDEPICFMRTPIGYMRMGSVKGKKVAGD